MASAPMRANFQEAHVHPASIQYDAIDRLLFLDEKHIILVFDRDQKLLEQLAESTVIPLYSAIGYLQGIFGISSIIQFDSIALKNARCKTKEQELSCKEFYLCSKSGMSGIHPTRVTRQILSAGKPAHAALGPCKMLHYCYLELPFVLEDGCEYTVTTKENAKVTFTYSLNRCISHALKVNQVGYLPHDEKFAYFGGYLQEWGSLELPEASNMSFLIVDAVTGKNQFQGQVTFRSQDCMMPKIAAPYSGEQVYELDFSKFTTPGRYFIKVNRVGRSWEFTIDDTIYGEAAFTAFRGFYHQRCGCPIGGEWSRWPRVCCHTEAVYPSEAIPFITPENPPDGYENFDVIAATIDLAHPIKGVIGGWHDAADWDRNIQHYTCLFDLLFAYEMQPKKFSRGQFQIPNRYGLPDILEEVVYGLQVWKASQAHDGAVSGLVETFAHPSINDPEYPYAISKKCRWSSLLFAAAAAQFSRLVLPFNSELAHEYFRAAMSAYSYGMESSNSMGAVVIKALLDRGKGAPYTLSWQENEENLLPFKVFASWQLYSTAKASNRLSSGFIVTGTDSLRLFEYAKRTWSDRTTSQYSIWLYYLMTQPIVAELIGAEASAHWKELLVQKGLEELAVQRIQPYRESWPLLRDYWLSWGISCMANKARLQLIAFELSREERLLQGARRNLDYLFGCNPLGLSWTTGIGSSYPVFLQHAVSEDDGIDDPVPGITLFGVNEGIPWYLSKCAWESEGMQFITTKNQNIPLWRRFSQHQHLNVSQNEFTVHETMSAVVFCTLYCMPEEWKSTKLPRPKERNLLYGIWMVP